MRLANGMPIKTLSDLEQFLIEKGWPEKLIISGQDYKYIVEKHAPGFRTVPMQIGPTMIWPKTSPELDVSDSQVFDYHEV